MAIALSGLLPSLRREIDPQISYDDPFTADGIGYVYPLTNRPVTSQTISVFLNHVANTSGVDQVVPSGNATAAAGFYYDAHLNRGQVALYSGVYPTGVIFQPWAGATIKVFYDATNYTDSVLAGYLGSAIPAVESQLSLGYKLVDTSPSGVGVEDSVGFMDINGVDPNEVGVSPEPLQLTAMLMVKEATLLILNRERRLGIKSNQGATIRDGDIEINTGNTYRASESAIKDLKEELKQAYADIKLNMDSGIGILQLNEHFMLTGDPIINYDKDEWRG